jgi:2-keto-4-pentenoate hydratase/2-oxohepta-3-ene-1,7-dioic acid hydratase in catechol pathway
MRITRFQDPSGAVHLGADLGDGTARPLRGPAPAAELPETAGAPVRIAHRLPPLHPTNLFCIGLNYRRHADEGGSTVGEHPILFMKPTTAVIATHEPIRLPAAQHKGPEVDLEAELAVVIGKAGRDIRVEHALEHVFGYTAAHDVSARRWQKHAGGGQWIRGKGFDTFCPLGPVLVTADEIPDPQALSIGSRIDGETMQQSNTSDMIWSVAELVSFLSMDTTLLPGTVLLTGTPEGVGFARQPPRFLQAGEEVTVEIGTIGPLTNPVKDAEA